MPCSRIQNRRVTSQLGASAARRLFLKLIWCSVEEPPDCAARCPYPLLAHRHNDLVQCQVRLLRIRASSHSACSSSRDEVLPPLRFAAKLPVSSRRCLHSTAAPAPAVLDVERSAVVAFSELPGATLPQSRPSSSVRGSATTATRLNFPSGRNSHNSETS